MTVSYPTLNVGANELTYGMTSYKIWKLERFDQRYGGS